MNKKTIATCLIIAAFALSVAWWLWGRNVQFITGNYEKLSRTTSTTYKSSAVSLAVGELLIFKTPKSQYGAIQFVKMTPDTGADYKSWTREPSDSSTYKWSEYRGHVFEKYWSTQTRPKHYRVNDIGGHYYIKCGDLRLQWSASTWIYFPSGFEVSVVRDKSITQINAPDLLWKTQPYDSALSDYPVPKN